LTSTITYDHVDVDIDIERCHRCKREPKHHRRRWRRTWTSTFDIKVDGGV